MKSLALVALLALAMPASTARVTVFAAASLAQVLPQLAPSESYSFAGSDQLAYQIEQGAPADVFAAASPKYPDQLYRDGLVERPVTFATNRLILLVPAANPAGLHSVFDLRRPRIKLVIGQKGVPIGDYTRAVLKNLDLTSVLANVVSEESDVKNIVGKVVLGQADAGFVYLTDARPAGARAKTIRIPAWGQPKVRYELAIVRASKHFAGARSFVKRVLGKQGRAKLAAAGFGLP